jgi:hypothetical protein
MNETSMPVRPPRIAGWFVELFASPHEAEGIVGDLVEEFQTSVIGHGEPEARRRFRRQAWQTIRDLALTPWQTTNGPRGRATRRFAAIGLALLALGAVVPVGWTINAAARLLVVQAPVYSYVPASWFWWATDLAGPLTTGFLAALIALAAGLRPVSLATLTLAGMALLFALDVPVMVWLYGPPARGVPITVGFLVYRWFAGLALFGGAFWVGAALGRLLPLPSRMLGHA